MRRIQCRAITETVASLFRDACIYLPPDVIASLKRAARLEKSPLGRETIKSILRNIAMAKDHLLPICQDTGTAVVFLEIGQDTHIIGGNLTEAINRGVKKGYAEGYLRKSIVHRPFSARKNTGDNTPAVIHSEIVPGDGLRIYVLPKGGGAENCSRLTVMPPSLGHEGIVEYVINLVDECGSNACPPLILGIGIGGTTEQTMLLAKKALLRKTGSHNTDTEIKKLEQKILAGINMLGIGPMGYGGSVTALAVHIEAFPAHIASMPVAVNMQCWCSRHREAVL
ncbi:MAG: fumarate hydratase [Dehalococcoidia bacterium]|nr:fumarate hydratase [Dehalococcoidia bacterium]